ncbi:hypothetical protein AKJ09_06893 [Labilithrix luteola]|uniref:Uncharacterized protein n=1 Tax=Labilithrix luteola TaxID=1391654 RepID=A0A0K1Q4D4_9BACT|nr:hypothetical protein AKJ09_06893 [Labilithrix luteola]
MARGARDVRGARSPRSVKARVVHSEARLGANFRRFDP